MDNEQMAAVKKGQRAGVAAAIYAGELWRRDALDALISYAKQNSDVFSIKDVRDWAYKSGLVERIPETRAWGGVILAAKSKGLVRKVITNFPRHAHGTAIALWEYVGQ